MGYRFHPDDPELLMPIEGEETIPDLCGWVPDPEEVDKVLATIPQPLFGDAAPHLAGSWDGKSDIKLWDACIKVTGSNLPAHRQTIGDCVSQGAGSGCDYVQCTQIALGKQQKEFVVGRDESYTEAIYGMMRKRAGQLSNQDGAVGIWSVNSLVNDGTPFRKGRSYKGTDAKLWGAKGPPQELYIEAKTQVLKQFVQVRTTKEATDLLVNGYPITVCSNQGFTMRRNENGICEAQGTWAHCMLCIGALMINGELFFVILQSWGSNVPSGPVIHNQPDCSFNIRESVFQRMLNAKDSYALSGLPGMPAQDITNFYV